MPYLPPAESAAALANEDVMIDSLIELLKQHGVCMTWVLTGTGEPVIAWWDDDSS